MSVEEETAAIIKGRVVDPLKSDNKIIQSAIREVKNILAATKQSLPEICADVENAPTKLALRQALAPLNEIMGIFLGLALSGTDGKRLAEYVGSLDLSDRLKAFIQAAASLREALKNYKTTIMEQLAVTLRSREDQKRSASELDDELFSMLLPDPISPLSEAEVPPIASAPAAVPPVEVGLKKRSASSMENLTVIPKKKSSIPALASLAQVFAENTTENTPKKKILMTRERLRRSMHDLAVYSTSLTRQLVHWIGRRSWNC